MRALSDDEQILEFAATDRAGNEEPRQRLILPAPGRWFMKLPTSVDTATPN